MENKKSSLFMKEAIVLAVAIVIALPLRFLQYGSLIEANTGFYTGFSINFVIFYVVLVGAAGYFIVSSFLKRKKIHLDTDAKKLPGCGIISFLSAFAVLLSAWQSFTRDDTNVSQYIVTPSVPGIAVTAMEIFAILTAVYFVLLGISFMSGKSCGSKFKLLSLSPVIWNVIRLVVHFTTTVSYIRISDLTLDMLSLAAYAIFFMSFAQTNSMVNGEGLEWKVAGFGLVSALLGVVCFVPRMVLTLIGRADLMYVLSSADVSDLMFAVFMVATTLTRILPGKKSQIVPEKTAEE